MNYTPSAGVPPMQGGGSSAHLAPNRLQSEPAANVISSVHGMRACLLSRRSPWNQQLSQAWLLATAARCKPAEFRTPGSPFFHGAPSRGLRRFFAWL